jgi:hypothetical protein
VNWAYVLRVTTLVGAAMILVGLVNGGLSSSATGLPRALCFAGTAVACGSAAVMAVLRSRKSGT